MLKPIKNEEDHGLALARIEQLFGAEPGTPESDELDVLVILVHDYESRTHPVLPPDPIDAIKFRMDQLGMQRRELEQLTGPSGRVSEVLSGKRQLTLRMIRALHRHLGIPVKTLITEKGAA